MLAATLLRVMAAALLLPSKRRWLRTDDIGNFFFGGSSSDQAITLGGVARDDGSGVNDMTYVLLKVTELLKLRDPNVNARFSTEHNSETYLRRLCEVNLITAATPSLHGDEAVMRSIESLGYTATTENLTAIAAFLSEVGARRVSLLGYNPLWHDKAEKVGAEASASLRDWMDREDEERCREIFADFELVDS